MEEQLTTFQFVIRTRSCDVTDVGVNVYVHVDIDIDIQVVPLVMSWVMAGPGCTCFHSLL